MGLGDHHESAAAEFLDVVNRGLGLLEGAQRLARRPTIASPALVSRAPRLTRWNSCTPSSRSRLWIARLSDGCATFSAAAALVKVP